MSDTPCSLCGLEQLGCVYRTVNIMLESLLWYQKKQVSVIVGLFLRFSLV